jgi:hypothetical protein
MKGVVLCALVGIIIVFSGCTEIEDEEIIEETTTTIELVNGLPRDIWDDANSEMEMLEDEMDFLLSEGSLVGPNHYNRLRERTEALRDLVDDEDFDRLWGKIDRLASLVPGESSPNTTQITTSTTTKTEDGGLPVPECSGQLFTVPPVEIDEIGSITPLGSVNPPGHTLPTEHMYLSVDKEWGTTDITPLRVPADVYIETISSSSDAIVGEERTEYVIMFALCKDVHGYFDHVKELSDEILSLFEDAECLSWSVYEGDYCTKDINRWVDAGEVIGGVGHLQGNFDLGVYDLRKTSAFANVSRYSSRTPYIQCPLDYYDETTKAQLYSKIIDRTAEPLCGEVMQDVPGTLQGNWFHEDTVLDVDWETNLAFVHDNLDPSNAIISVAGKFMDPSKWVFTERTSGFVNRKFSDVTPGEIYCYDEGHAGRIVVQLVSDMELKIEYQSGDCSGEFSFSDPATYYR